MHMLLPQCLGFLYMKSCRIDIFKPGTRPRSFGRILQAGRQGKDAAGTPQAPYRAPPEGRREICGIPSIRRSKVWTPIFAERLLSLSLSLSLYIYIYTHLYICIYIQVCMCTYVYIYVYEREFTEEQFWGVWISIIACTFQDLRFRVVRGWGLRFRCSWSRIRQRRHLDT